MVSSSRKLLISFYFDGATQYSTVLLQFFEDIITMYFTLFIMVSIFRLGNGYVV